MGIGPVEGKINLTFRPVPSGDSLAWCILLIEILVDQQTGALIPDNAAPCWIVFLSEGDFPWS